MVAAAYELPSVDRNCDWLAELEQIVSRFDALPGAAKTLSARRGVCRVSRRRSTEGIPLPRRTLLAGRPVLSAHRATSGRFDPARGCRGLLEPRQLGAARSSLESESGSRSAWVADASAARNRHDLPTPSPVNPGLGTALRIEEVWRNGADSRYGQPHRKDPQVVADREEVLTGLTPQAV
jgi:hypothetical protein